MTSCIDEKITKFKKMQIKSLKSECNRLSLKLPSKYKTKQDIINYIMSNGIDINDNNELYLKIDNIKTNIKVTNTIITENINNTTNKLYECSEDYMKQYLSTIETKNNKYKRVCISPLRYAGGKSKAIGLILSNLPKLKRKKIISPFFGGGSFELCASQILDIEVIGYDIFGMLVNFWDTLINNKDEFITELKKLNVNKEEFTYNRHILLNYWDTEAKPDDLNYKTKNKIELNEIDKTKLHDNNVLQAVYYYYNMTLSYGPMFLGWPSSNEINEDKFARRIKKLENLNLKNLSVEESDFEDVISKHPDDFIFLDPPYYLEGDSKMFKGMYPNCNFAIHHNKFNHKRMCELLKNHKGGFMITYNNCSPIREMYKEYKFEYPEWQYTYGQGETRVGKNRMNNSTNSTQVTIDDVTQNVKEEINNADKKNNIKESHEIFIISWPDK
tara:strand:- start:7435 stop:8763 length:1329 start_codon:yes stop_codon:yes gene_type:complete